MNEAGELIEWDDARGFGMVRPAGGGRLFVHISAFGRTLRRPQIGDRLAFRRGPGRDGRPAVLEARIAGLPQPAPRPAGPSAAVIESARTARALRLLVATLLLGLVIVLRLPGPVLLIYLGMGTLSALLYVRDKQAARAGAWRISEATLHGVDLMGGIVGGLIAQAALHHKTASPRFGIVSFALAFCHALLLVGLAIA